MVRMCKDIFTIMVGLVVCTLLIAKQVQGLEGNRRRLYARLAPDLRDLAKMDFETVVKLKSFKENLESNGQSSSLFASVDKYLTDFAKSKKGADNVNVTDHVDECVRNPVAMFGLLHRVATFLRNSRMESNDGMTISNFLDLPLQKLKVGDDSSNLNLRDDLVDAADAILQIHFMYNLSASDLAAGKVKGLETRARLDATHCLYIGLLAKLRREYTLALEWLKEARRLAKTDRTVDVPIVQAELAEMIREHDSLWKRQDFTDAYFFMKRLRSLRSLDNDNIILRSKDLIYKNSVGKGTNGSYWSANVWGQCSGENLHTPRASARLFCWLEFKVNKIFTIGPLKMEFLSRNPDIVQIHAAFPTATEEMDEELVNRKVGAITGLQTVNEISTEPTEIVSHIPGGNNDIHVDSLLEDDYDVQRKGLRIATFMIYLSNVKAGGYTAFPTAFATAIPTKGSAIFWFNSFPDGTPDFSTAHADCPVVLGEKSASYKWIRFNDQFSARKCPLNPRERFQVLVNGKKLRVPNVFHHKLISEEEYVGAKSLSVAEEAPWDYHDDDIPRRKYSYSPSTALKSAIRLDWSIFHNVKRIFTTVEEPLTLQSREADMREQICRYLEDFNETVYNSILQANTTEMEAVTKLAGNPLAPYRTFWRFENYVKKWMTEEFEGEPGKLFRRIRDYLGSVYSMSDGPVGMDLEDAMTGILNIQFVHELKSDEISRGVLAGRDAGLILSAKQCIEIGIQAIGRGFFYQAIEWMQTAVDKILYEEDVSVELQEAEMQLETSKIVHDKAMAKADGLDLFFYVSPVSGLNNLSQVETRRRALYNKYKFRREYTYSDLNLAGICQGHSHQTTAEKSKLFCWYETEMHPYLKIGPTKMEILSVRPKAEVLLYHDVLGEKLAAHLRNDTNRHFIVSTSTGAGGTDSRVRISATSFIQENASPEMGRIFNLMQRITGLNPRDQRLNLNSYTPGGHFGAHPDSGSFSEHGQFTRLGTFMFYITDPEMGGGTAFAQTGVHVTPKAGSAILWYNVLSSGEADEEMYHGGCPVIFGEKRVATQFMHHHEQRHLFCHTDPARRIQVLVNGKPKLGDT